MKSSNVQVLNAGMECLLSGLGTIDAERFISLVMKEQFDYTEWQREHFDRMPPETIRERALAYAEKHPYSGDPSKRL